MRTKTSKGWLLRNRYGNDDDPSGNTQGTPPDYKALYDQTVAALNSLKSSTTSTDAYTGLQRTLTKEQQAKQTAEQLLLQKTTELSELAASHGTQLTEMTTLKADKDAKEKALNELSVKYSRMNLIIREFPELLAFEADNLVPSPADAIKPDGTLDEEKLRTTYKAFSAKLQLVNSATKQTISNGGTPPNPPGQSVGATATELLRKSIEAQRKGDLAEQNRLYSEYIKASGAK